MPSHHDPGTLHLVGLMTQCVASGTSASLVPAIHGQTQQTAPMQFSDLAQYPIWQCMLVFLNAAPGRPPLHALLLTVRVSTCRAMLPMNQPAA